MSSLSLTDTGIAEARFNNATGSLESWYVLPRCACSSQGWLHSIMVSFSIGVVSGIIAAIIAAVQFIVPNLLVVILVAFLRDDQSAVTWSVVSRTLSSSLWPVVLRSDLASSRGVSNRVKLITGLTPLFLLIVAIAAIVTPIGLYETLVVAKDTQLAEFSYLADSGMMGVGTPPRSPLGFSRQCWGVNPQQCPGTTSVLEYTQNGSGVTTTFVDGDYDRRIPHALAQLYQSGLADQPESVSSFFDIQARHYQFKNSYSTNDTSYLVDSFRSLTSLVKDNGISLVDGLVVDMKTGGIGFRNHTAPLNLRYGAEWEEDITFLEPETVCVDLNMTLETQVEDLGETFNSSKPRAYLIDQGGYVNIQKASPYLPGWFDDLQIALMEDGDPSLEGRAFRAGWWTNAQFMLYFNVTSPGTNRSEYLTSEVGSRFPVNTTYSVEQKDRLAFGGFSSLVSSVPSAVDFYNGTISVSNISSFSGTPYWTNPFNMSMLNFTNIDAFCSATAMGDLANMTNIGVKCGLLLGPSRRVDGENSLVFTPGSWWTRPVYSCASATKVSIKSVQFRYNASTNTGLQSLQAVGINDKVYPNQSAMPLWGVESANMPLRNLDPFWGLVSPELEDSVNLTVVRADHIYVPASSKSVWGNTLDITGLDFNPASGGPSRIWGQVYNGYSLDGASDYSGASDLALQSKWLDLSRNSSGASQIANLIWTDYAVNYFVGTRSWLDPSDEMPPNLQRLRRRQDTATAVDSSTGKQVLVHIIDLRIRYHWVYAIPAAICLAISLVIFIGAALAVILRRASISRIRHYLWNLSSGRILGSFLFPGASNVHSTTNTWIDQVGNRNIRISESPQESEKSFGPHRTYTALNQEESPETAVVTSVDLGKADGDHRQHRATEA